MADLPLFANVNVETSEQSADRTLHLVRSENARPVRKGEDLKPIKGWQGQRFTEEELRKRQREGLTPHGFNFEKGGCNCMSEKRAEQSF